MKTDLTNAVAQAIQHGALHYSYRDREMQKNPFDLALYQLLLWRQRPGTIFEIGSRTGASAMWLADTAAMLGLDTAVVSLDICRVGASHPRCLFLTGDARDISTIIGSHIIDAAQRPFLVIDDASHRYEDVRQVIWFFQPVLRPGEYLVVEDGILSLLYGDDAFQGGPLRAIEEAVAGDAWEIDRAYCDFFGVNVTWNTDGYLRRR